MSLTKNELKDIQSLLAKKGRNLKKTFLAEGVRLLEEAVRYHVRPTCVCYAEAAISDRGRQLVEQFAKSGVRVESVHLRELESIAATETSQGILATFAVPTTGLTELYQPAFRRVVLCENISDPGNLGTLLRSAKAFRFDMVLLAGRSADPFSPKVVRASVGAIFGLPIAVAGVDEIVSFATRQKAQLLAADIHGTTEVVKASIRREKMTILAIGSEADGLSDELLQRADTKIRIRHSDAVESLNAAVAGSILMHELYNLYE